VAIIDWDAHHGNGTQKIFYDTDRVLYCSIHEKESFPHTGLIKETGSGSGEGFTVNAPIRQDSTIADYQFVFDEIFIPALQRYDPDLVIISAGQDVLSDDPIASMKLVPDDIGKLTQLVRGAGDYPLALMLEGGYGPSHPDAICSIFDALQGKIARPIPLGMPGKVTIETVQQLKKIHRIS
jgi:acetoin utilization deacetylase AcuC-like enzyme